MLLSSLLQELTNPGMKSGIRASAYLQRFLSNTMVKEDANFFHSLSQSYCVFIQEVSGATKLKKKKTLPYPDSMEEMKNQLQNATKFIITLIPFTVANTHVALTKLSHFILLTTQRGRSSYHLHFIGDGIEDTESLVIPEDNKSKNVRDQRAWPRIHTLWIHVSTPIVLILTIHCTSKQCFCDWDMHHIS